MLPNGCFGSSLAHAPETATCRACPAKKACAKIVNKRYPILMRLLSRFTDARGVRMSEPWLSEPDKKALRAMRKVRKAREAETATFGDPAVGAALRASLDKRMAPTVNRCVALRVNPFSASIAKLKTISKPMKSALTALSIAPQHRTTIERAIASDSALSAATAARETSAIVSLLVRCNRLTVTNNVLEIK